MERKLLLCIQYKSPISRWVMPEGRGQGPIHSIYDGDDDDDDGDGDDDDDKDYHDCKNYYDEN